VSIQPVVNAQQPRAALAVRWHAIALLALASMLLAAGVWGLHANLPPHSLLVGSGRSHAGSAYALCDAPDVAVPVSPVRLAVPVKVRRVVPPACTGSIAPEVASFHSIRPPPSA
jgi:hypothetical protein